MFSRGSLRDFPGAVVRLAQNQGRCELAEIQDYEGVAHTVEVTANAVGRRWMSGRTKQIPQPQAAHERILRVGMTGSGCGRRVCIALCPRVRQVAEQGWKHLPILRSSGAPFSGKIIGGNTTATRTGRRDDR